MSYGIKYTLTFRDSTVVSNKLWKLNIYANGYSGSSIAVTGADSPIQLSYKKVNLTTAICGSELTIALQANTVGQFDEFLTAAPLAYYVEVLNSTDGGSTWNPYWYGVNTTDTYSQAHSNAPYNVSLKFNCGLGELQWHRYEDGGSLTVGIEQVIQMISNCMSFLPYTLGVTEIINVREDTMSDSEGLLQQLYLSDMGITEIGDDGETHGWNCNKLLNNIFTSINCRIYQSDGVWFVERIYERIHTSVYYFGYALSNTWQSGNSFTYSASGTLAWSRTINNASYPKIIKTSEKAVTQLQPILSYKFNPGSINNVQLIPDPYLENTPLNKGLFNRPNRWIPSSAITALDPNAGDGLETIDQYDPDIQYQSGYSFGSTILADNTTYVTTYSPYLNANAWLNFKGSIYNIHALRNSTDTYTFPVLTLDPDNSSIVVNIRQYCEFKITPNYTSAPTMTQTYNDAMSLLYSGYFMALFRMYFKSLSTGHVLL